MNSKTLLNIAAGLTLFTFVGHSLGNLLPKSGVDENIAKAYLIMQETMVPMPMGVSRSLAQTAYGGNVIISLYLLVSGLLLILQARSRVLDRSILLLNSVGLIACAGFSAIFFFPLPAICTALAGGLGFFVSLAKKS